MARAGRIAVAQRSRLLAEGRTFGIETTLTGNSELQLMRAAKAKGYKVNLVYVGLENAGDSNSRVTTRVQRGGHDVPEQDILRRFDRSLANLPIAMQLSDTVRVLNNSGERRRPLLKINQGRVRDCQSHDARLGQAGDPCRSQNLPARQGFGALTAALLSVPPCLLDYTRTTRGAERVTSR